MDFFKSKNRQEAWGARGLELGRSHGVRPPRRRRAGTERAGRGKAAPGPARLPRSGTTLKNT